MLDKLQNYWIYKDYIQNDYFEIDVESISKDNWNLHYDSVLNIFRDGIESDVIANKFITLNLDGKKIRLSLPDYFINLVLWYMFIQTGLPIELKHIFFPKEITSMEIKKYIDEFFIARCKKFMDNKKLNNVIADMLHYLGFVDEFSMFFVNSINIQDDIDMMNAIPEYYDLLHPDLSNVSIADAKKFGMECIYKIEEYVKDAKKYIGHDHIYTNAFRAKESINLKQLREYMCFIGAKPDGEGGVFPHIIPTSFISGGVEDNLAYFIESAAGRTAQIMAKLNIGTSGAFGTNLGLNNTGSFLHHDPNYVCNTTNYIKITIKSKKMLSYFAKRYYRESPDGFEKLIDINDESLVGKTLYFRSPITCASASRGDGICYRCYGDLAYVNKDINIGKYASEETNSNFTQRLLSAKHLLETVISKIDWSKEFREHFEIDVNIIKIKEDANVKNAKLYFNTNDIFVDNEEDVEGASDEEMLDSMYNEYVPSFTLVINNKHYKFETPEIDRFYLSKELSAAIQRNAKSYTEESYVSLKDIGSDDPLFFIEIQNNELSRTMKLAQSILNKQDVTSTFNKDSITQAYLETIIEGGLSILSVHNEVLISNQIRAADDILDTPNWVNENEPYQLLTLNRALFNNPSVTTSLAYEKVSMALQNPLTYKKTKSASLDLFYMEQPQMFLNRDIVRIDPMTEKDRQKGIVRNVLVKADNANDDSECIEDTK